MPTMADRCGQWTDERLRVGPSVPDDYDVRIRALRRAHGLSQAQLATLVGAARKAVVYQWETRKRTPSPLFWQRIAALLAPVVSPSITGARTRDAFGRR